MTASDQTPRRPKVFAPDDPRLKAARAMPEPSPPPSAAPRDEAVGRNLSATDGDLPQAGRRIPWPTAAGVSQGIRAGTLFVSAVVALATLAATVSFLNFAAVALARDDWIGWTAVGLLGIAAASGLVLIGREVLGLMRLGRLGRLRRELDAAIADSDATAERSGLARLKALYATRAELRWPLARLAEHERDIHDPGALLRLADRDLMAPLDQEARRIVLRSAKRVATVTAMLPFALLTLAFVLSENIGLLRRLAELYGGRPGMLGSFRLARLVVAHLVGTGGIAMTDDLLGQFLGHDILRRLSARLGEGVINGALTARLGAAAIEVVRPLSFIETQPVRARDIVAELFRSEPELAGDAGPAGTGPRA